VYARGLPSAATFRPCAPAFAARPQPGDPLCTKPGSGVGVDDAGQLAEEDCHAAHIGDRLNMRFAFEIGPIDDAVLHSEYAHQRRGEEGDKPRDEEHADVGRQRVLDRRVVISGLLYHAQDVHFPPLTAMSYEL
jgi:hypothetical protein